MSSAPKIDINFIKPFIEATIETLKVQCSTTIKVGKPYKRVADTELPNVDIAGIIGVTSSSFSGSISLCFPSDTFLKIMGGMLGEEFEVIDKDLEDGAGELLNIIFGFAKRMLNDQGYDIEKAIPSIVTGKDISVQHLSEEASAICPFTLEELSFYIEIAMD
jgi:chemotaxis protein CheX